MISAAIQDTVFAASDSVTALQGIDWLGWVTLVVTVAWLALTYLLLDRNTKSVSVAEDALQIEERRHRASMYPTLHYEVVEREGDDRFHSELHVLNLSDRAVFQVEILVLFRVAVAAEFWVDSSVKKQEPLTPSYTRDDLLEDVHSVGIRSPLVQRIEIHSLPPSKKYVEVLRCPAEPIQFELLIQVRTADNGNYIQSRFYDKYFKMNVTYHTEEEPDNLVDFEMNTDWEVIEGTYLTGGDFFGFKPMPRAKLKRKDENRLGYELVSGDGEELPDELLRFQEFVDRGMMVDQFLDTSLKPFERYRFEDL